MKGGSVQQCHVVDDESKIGEARRAAQTLAGFEFTAEMAGRVAIVATELATNLLRHAGGGELLMQALSVGDTAVLELLAVDRGPGMGDVNRCLQDGYSTGGTQGTGLGAVRRMADEFDISSTPGEGTVVMARFGERLARRLGAICVPVTGEIECGDAWRLHTDGNAATLMMIDGLGHGPLAAEAARTGIAAFSAAPFDSPLEVMQRAGAAMSKTRGGAAACAQLRPDGTLAYCGIGNIGGSLVSADKSQGLVSQAGTLGMHGRRAQQFEYPRAPGTKLVMHSDGLSARWNLRERPELLQHHPAVLAGILYRDFARDRDDVTVVVLE